MAATTPGNEFHEDQILDLAQGWASTIWFRILCNDKFRGIEWGSLSKELVNTHHSWFTTDELAKLSDLKPYSKDALTSAVKRNAPGVLHAFYQSLCATQFCGGASQHASIAADIQKETLMAAVTKSYTYPPASNQLQSFSSWPTDAQLASATAQFVHWKTTEAQRCRIGTPAMKKQEEWEGVVAFICHHFGGNTPRDVVSALHREIVPRHQSYPFPPSSQELSEAIQHVVKERCMTWVQFARYLLLSKTTRPFVFKIVQYTRVGIRFVFKQVLIKNLGSDWYRLACAMGLPKTDVDNIEDRKDITLLGKIDAFLMTYHFPAFRSDEETTEFLVEALERACLFSTAAAVRRDLKNALQREVEATRAVDTTAVHASPSSVKQPVTVSSGVGSPAKQESEASKRYEKNERQNLELYAEDADQQAFTEEDCTRLYHKAITKHSTINLHVAKVMTIGPPRVGKTFVRHLLLDLETPKVSVSTPLMKTAETVSIISPQEEQREMETEVETCDDGLAQADSREHKSVHSAMIHLDSCETQKFTWLLMNNASGMQSFLNCLQQEDEASTYRLEAAEESAETVITDAVPTPESHAVPTPESLSEDTVEVMDAFTADGVPGCMEEKAVIPPSAVTGVASRIHQLLQSPNITNFKIPDSKLVQFLDCGGQHAYHDILPVFTTIPAVYLHVFNVNVNLQDHPVDQICFSPGDEVYASAKSPLSIAGMISRSVMTVNSLVDKNMQLPPGVLQGEPPEPRIVMVGTHLDKLAASSKEAIKEKFESVDKALNEALPSRHLQEMLLRNRNPHLPAMFFPVGRLSPQPDKESESLRHTTKQSISALKQRIEKLVSAVKVKVPVKWYLYAMLNICQSKEDCKPVYKYSDLFQLCCSEHAVEDCGEFHAMVTYFHALGLMIHLCGKDVQHHENSTCWVFTNPSYLFENISKLYQVQFLEEDRCEGSLQTLRSQGRLTCKALRALNVDNTYLSDDDFMTLLVQFFIGADITEKEGGRKDDRVLFVPSVIPVSSAVYLHTVITRPSCPYFIITFESKFFLPCGVFTGVIARLQSIPHWKMCYGGHSVSRLHAKFSIGALDTVYVIDNSTHIKVAADIHDINDTTSAEEYRNTVIDAVAQSYCFLFHAKGGTDSKCKFCKQSILVLGLLCRCTTCETKDIAELHTDCRIPKSVRCRSSGNAEKLQGEQVLFFWNIKHNAVKRDQHTLPKAKVESQCPPQSALPFSASQFLRAYETEFFEVVNAKQSLLKLKRKGVIPLDVKMAIDNANDEDAKDILFEHLEKNATVDTLRVYCDVAIEANGLPKMQALGRKMREALPPGDVQEGPVDNPQLPLMSHSTPVQKDPASAISTTNPQSTSPQLWASGKVATLSATGSLDDKPLVLDAADSENAQYIPKPHSMEVTQIPPGNPRASDFHLNTEDDLQMSKIYSLASHSANSFVMLPDAFSAYCDRMKMQSSLFTSNPSSSTQHLSSHPGHTGWSSRSPQLNMPDVKERLSRSDMTTDTTGHDGSCMVDPLSASSFPLKLSQQSLSRKSVTSVGPEHTSMNVKSHNEAQSGARIQLRTSHGTHTPDQSSMVSNPLWEMAKMPAVHTSAEVSSLMQSQHQKGSADNAEKSVCALAPGLHLHSDVVATSEPVIDMKGSFDLTSPHHSLQKASAPAPLARSPGPVHSSVTPAHLLSQHPNSSVSLALPHSPGSANSSETLPHVSSQQSNSSLSLTLPPSPEGFSDSEPEECDSTARPLKPPATNSAQFLQMQNSSLTGFPATSGQTHPSPSIIPTKEHILLSNPASHPSQQSALNEDSLDGETSDDDDDPRDKETSDYTPSDLTYQSSTSGPTTRNPTTDDSRNSSLSQALHPPTTGMQPRTSSHDAHSDLTYQSSTTSGPTRNPRTEDSRNSSFSQALHPPFLSITSAEVSSSIQSQHQKGSPDDDDDAHSDLTYQSSTTSGSNIWHLQNSSQFFSLATSDKTHPSPSTKEHSLLLNPASHPTQKSAPIEGTSEEETSNDDDDAHSDFTYQSSTTSGSTTRKPTTEDSQNSSLSQALHPPIASMQPRTSSLLTVSHPVTPALGIAGSGKMTSFADMHAPVGPHSNATGDEQSQTSGHPALLGMQPRTASLTPAVATAGCDEMTSFVDMHTAIGPHSNVTGDKQSHNSDQSAQALVNSREQQLSAHHSQKPTTHSNPSVNVPSHLEPAVVGLPPSKVPSMIDKSAETYPSAATVVEADTTGAPASSSPVEQPLAVSGKVGSSAVPSTLPDVHWQDSGYLCSHHFISSNISYRHLGSMDPSDRIQMDTSQREQDSQESVQCVEQLIGSSKKEVEMLAYVSRQVGQKWSMLARYAGLEKDEIQRIKRLSQNRPCTIMTKIQGRLTWNELLNVVQKHMHMLNTAAKLQHFLGRPVDALPDLVHNEIDPQQYSRTLLVASQCVSEHWKELAQYLGIDPHQHWDVLEESSDADEKCHGVLLLWLSGRRATLQELLEAVESTSAAAGSLQKLIEMARLDGQL